LIRTHVRNQIQTTYRKQFMVEMSFNMKSFCKHYHHFYYAGQSAQALQLIRAKALVSSVNFVIPIPGKRNMGLDFQVMTQNDLKKGLGIAMWKIGYHWDRSPTVNYKVFIFC
jgi:hypothetical protein